VSDTPSIELPDVNVTAPAPTNPTTSDAPKQQPPVVGGNVLTLIINNTAWQGWQRVAVARSMDTVPANFDIAVTEKYPYPSTRIDIKPGDPCQVKIGGDLVITGYVDRYSASLSAGEHQIRITGRSKSADLVDCSAFIGDKGAPSYQIKGGTTLSIARALAQPYGVEINSLAGEGKQIPQFNINLGETAWEIIDRITRYSAMVAYDMPDGSMVLAQAGSEKMASGFVQGVNIEQASVEYSMDQRFSEYEGFYVSALAYFTDSGTNPPSRGVIVTDPGVPRYRKHIIISEQSDNGNLLVTARTQWEKARRAGRSLAVTIVCDAWRDTAGALWAPNHQAPINLPALKAPDGTDWTIGAVTYTRDENGEHATVVLMPADAFKPEPTAFMPLPPTVEKVTQANNDAAKPPAAGQTTGPPPNPLGPA